MDIARETIRLIGIDCATQDNKIGVAFGSLSNGRLRVSRAFVCGREEKAADAICDWLKKKSEPALLALDAPLGWPQTLSRVLADHRAGEKLAAGAHQMFRRETDRFIKTKTGKTPLDVGADRIARTAYAALKLPQDIRSELKLKKIPLAWNPSLTAQVSVIEVYPAATLIAHGFSSDGYKNSDQSAVRKKIIKQIGSLISFDSETEQKMIGSCRCA